MEEQQSLASQTPISEEERVRISHQNQDKMRKQQALNMNRARVVQQMEKATNDRYREMLQQELNYLETEMKKLS